MFLTRETKISQTVDEFEKPSKISKIKIFGITVFKSKTFVFEFNTDIK
tara:strand:- start:226 stop:369 length:144 start_codon:yes stop_codon:yes gene_type:complete